LVRYEETCVIADDAFDLSVLDVARRRAVGEPLELVDVRTAREREIATLAPDRWIPLSELAERWRELPADRPLVVYCHSGGRSARATDFLRRAGLARVYNLAGGIDAWSREVDPALPRY
jgi:adenylyltransferase/sulfurtransferase